MASTNPDPTTLGSSADIFSGSYTLPQIRSLHKSLHVQIEEKSTRLRTQVGGSYRQLLGTADTIVHMRGENEQVQDLLGRMGGRCGRSIISSKATGLAKFVAAREQTSGTTRETARLKLLECCRLTAGRILQGGGGVADLQMDKGERLVMATKIFVISRLLVKSLKEGRPSERAQQAVDAMGKSLDSLRRRLQRTMERLLEEVDEDADIDDVVKALCAYSLANSSGAKHAISHFIRVRQRAMETTLDMDHEERTTATATTGQDVVRSLRLYTKTILDVQALVPRKLSQALSSLKSQPLLADTYLRTIEGLRLDICRRWCSEEMQDFTPFIPHDDLDSNQAREMLASFAEKGAKVVVSGLERTLHHMLDFNSIIDLRTQMLQLWIRDGGRARGFDTQDMQDALRETFNARLVAVVEAKAAKLRLVGSEISATLQGWQDGVSDYNKGLWDDDGYDAALSNGAVPFLEEVVSRLHGRNDAVSKASHSYASWFHIIGDVKAVVEQLRKQRWDNDYDEIEDEETMETRQEALSREDPRKLQDTLDETLDASFAALEKHIQQLWDQHSEHTSSGAMAIYLIRVVRDIRAHLPDRPAVKSFGMSMVPGWHSRVAALAWRPAAATFISKGLSDKSVVMKPLWEGQPLLPGQPSPSVSHLLRDLSLAMTDLGVDLWTPAATGTLKKQLGESLCEAWRKELEDVLSMDGEGDTRKQVEEEDTEDKEKGEEGEQGDRHQDKDASKRNKPNDKPNDQRKEEPAEPNETSPTGKVHDICTQWLFDVSLLQCCIGKTQGDTASHYAELAEQLAQQSGLDEPARKKVAKMAGNYWRRINLLFGLVA
ncbi:uncharacterized protein CPUR_00491 [Claviceps purpurea 20.1]|uniref:Conserved oligomeric Golgi complex subunit 1 n=1 Tax=Claviceps purpurea (strain 20.1) TaxID=1111077 RepID=M1W9B8_CLAP2|nr:uncharacterized protein CPUR_00491 [Claviceps purpurea 20.1]